MEAASPEAMALKAAVAVAAAAVLQSPQGSIDMAAASVAAPAAQASSGSRKQQQQQQQQAAAVAAPTVQGGLGCLAWTAVRASKSNQTPRKGGSSEIISNS